MSSFDDIQNLWQNQPEIKMPTVAEIMAAVNKKRWQLLSKTIIGTVTLVATFIFICFIAFKYDFTYATTRIGIVLTLIAITGAVVLNTQLLQILLKTVSNTVDSNTYLLHLLAYQTKQRFFQTTGLSIYFVVLSVGITMYMYEFASRDLKFGIIAYTLTLGWIALNWFVIRPRTIKKQEDKLNRMIESIQSIAKQLESKG